MRKHLLTVLCHSLVENRQKKLDLGIPNVEVIPVPLILTVSLEDRHAKSILMILLCSAVTPSMAAPCLARETEKSLTSSAALLVKLSVTNKVIPWGWLAK